MGRRKNKDDREDLLDEAVRRANEGPKPRKVAGTITVVVYDDTQTNPPPGTTTYPTDVGFRPRDVLSLTFWWHTGGLMSKLQGYAEGVRGASNWREAIQAALDVVGAHSPGTRIGSLQFWGHGADGHPFMAGDLLDVSSFEPGSAHHDLLKELRDVMHPQQGSVWFRSCNVFRKDKGREFARAAASFLHVPIVGHTFITHVFQSGTEVARPGQQLEWPDDLGVARRADPTDLQWSGPLRKRTVTMFKFYPPMDRSDFVPGKSLVNVVTRLFS